MTLTATQRFSPIGNRKDSVPDRAAKALSSMTFLRA